MERSESRGNSGCFKKGNVPWCTGKTKDLYPQLSNSGRKPGGIPSNKLKLDEERLVDLYKSTDLTLEEIGEVVGCSSPVVIRRLKALGVYQSGKVRKKRKYWTEDRVKKLKEMYPTLPTEEVAAYFGKSVSNIQKQAQNFGIKKEIMSHSARKHKDGESLCARCKTWKADSDFHKNSSRRYGLHTWCKSCMYENQKEYAKKNPDKIKRWRRAYYLRNRRRRITYTVDWGRRNTQRRNEMRKRWRERNPEKYKIAAINHYNMRSRILESSDVTTDYLIDLKAIFVSHGRCPVCDTIVDGVNLKWWLEHATPLSRGGKHSEENLVYTCNKCNNSKSTKTLEEFCGMTVDDVFAKVGAYAHQMEEAV